jgi:FkbM family methyltransferase
LKRIPLAAIRRTRILPTLAYAAGWLIPWRSYVKVRAAKSGLALFSHKRCYTARHIAKYGGLEPDITDWLSGHLSTCRPGLFVDIGANIGWYALHAARMPAVEKVVAFEPDPANARMFERNLRNDTGKVVLKVAAVGERRGTAQLHRYKNSNTARHSIVADHGMGSIAVPLVDLDGTLDELGLGDQPIAAIKIDVEGYEPAVIAGGRRALARTQAVILEFSPSLYRRAGLSIETMLQTLRNAGFSPFLVETGGTLRPDGVDRSSRDETVDLVWLKEAAPASSAVPPSSRAGHTS